MYDDTALQIIEYHRSMLDDKVRTTSFLRAIMNAVKPGDIVLAWVAAPVCSAILPA